MTILTTLADGTAVSKGLPEGWYELVEIGAPDGYALLDHSLWVQVTNNTTNDTYPVSYTHLETDVWIWNPFC